MDVGGGIGFATAAVCDKFPELNYVVQDLAGAIQNAGNVLHLEPFSSLVVLINNPLVLGRAESRCNHQQDSRAGE